MDYGSMIDYGSITGLEDIYVNYRLMIILKLKYLVNTNLSAVYNLLKCPCIINISFILYLCKTIFNDFFP